MTQQIIEDDLEDYMNPFNSNPSMMRDDKVLDKKLDIDTVAQYIIKARGGQQKPKDIELLIIITDSHTMLTLNSQNKEEFLSPVDNPIPI